MDQQLCRIVLLGIGHNSPCLLRGFVSDSEKTRDIERVQRIFSELA